jgi:hypothetical protein
MIPATTPPTRSIDPQALLAIHDLDLRAGIVLDEQPGGSY